MITRPAIPMGLVSAGAAPRRITTQMLSAQPQVPARGVNSANYCLNSVWEARNQ